MLSFALRSGYTARKRSRTVAPEASMLGFSWLMASFPFGGKIWHALLKHGAGCTQFFGRIERSSQTFPGT